MYQYKKDLSMKSQNKRKKSKYIQTKTYSVTSLTYCKNFRTKYSSEGV